MRRALPVIVDPMVFARLAKVVVAPGRRPGVVAFSLAFRLALGVFGLTLALIGALRVFLALLNAFAFLGRCGLRRFALGLAFEVRFLGVVVRVSILQLEVFLSLSASLTAFLLPSLHLLPASAGGGAGDQAVRHGEEEHGANQDAVWRKSTLNHAYPVS